MDDKNIRPPFTIPEAAEALHVTDHIVRQAIRRGELDAFRIGRLLRIRPESVDRLLRGAAE